MLQKSYSRRQSADTTDGSTLQSVPRSCWRYKIAAANTFPVPDVFRLLPLLVSLTNCNNEFSIFRSDLSEYFAPVHVDLSESFPWITDATNQRTSFDAKESSHISSSEETVKLTWDPPGWGISVESAFKATEIAQRTKFKSFSSSCKSNQNEMSSHRLSMTNPH